MGKRKSSRKPGAGKVKARPLDKVFKCLFCQHVNSVLCRMDRQTRTGRLDCKDCGQSFQAAITALDEPVDLYSEWIDACDAVNQPAPSAPSRAPSRPTRQAAPADDDEEDEDEELPEVGRARRTEPEADVDVDDDEGDAAEEDDGDEPQAARHGTTHAAAGVDPGYARPANEKMAALLASRQAREAEVGDEDDD